MNSTMTTEQKIEVIRQDFLDRDQDNYVMIRRSGRLGWESLIPQGGNYSDLLRDCRNEGDIIKEAYGIARDYIVAMDTPYRVTLRLSPEANCTDSKVVYLATRVFDDKDLSNGQKIDTFVGLAIHEGCHLKWTDFTQMGEARTRLRSSSVARSPASGWRRASSRSWTAAANCGSPTARSPTTPTLWPMC